MTPIHLFASRGDERIQKIVGLNAKPFAPGNLDPWPRLIFFAQGVAKFGGTTRRQRDHLIGEMRITIGSFVVAQSAQRFDDRVLGLRLARIDDVINLRHIAKVWMILLALGSRDPAIMSIGIAKEFSIAEITPQQPE